MPLLLIIIAFSTDVRAQTPIAYYPFTGNANDALGANNGIVSGATLTDDRFGIPNRAYNFNGTTDNITVPHNAIFAFDSTQAFSLCAWVKFCTSQPDGSTIGLFPGGTSVIGKGLIPNGPTTDEGYNLSIALKNQAAAMWHPFSAGSSTSAIGTTLLDDGKWHFLVAIYDNPAKSVQVYVDGVLDKTGASNTSDFSKSVLPLHIGYDPTYNFYFKGAIDDIRIYSVGLTANQVNTLHTENNWPVPGMPVGVIVAAQGATSICEGASVQLQATGSGPVRRYSWSPSAGISNTAIENPVATPSVTTTYTVTVYSAEPCALSASEEITINVSEAPKASGGATRFACMGETLQLNVEVTGGMEPYRYTWEPATGLDNPASATPRHVVTANTTYTVTIADDNGCEATTEVRVQLSPQPELELGPDVAMCLGQPIVIGADAMRVNDNPIYRWMPVVGLDDPSVAKPMANPTATTKYYVEVEDRLSGCKTTDSILVTVNPSPTANAGQDATICSGSSAQIGMVAMNGVTYQWNPPTGLSDPAAAMPTAMPSVTTTYTLTATNSADCKATDEVTITVQTATLQVAPATLNFGLLDGCTSSKELPVTLTNTGDVEITVTGATFDGTGFSIVSPGRPFKLAAGAQTEVVIRFAPPTAGAFNRELLIDGNPCSAMVTVDVSGTKAQTDVSTDLGAIDFGVALACQLATRDTTLIIRNDGTSPVTIEPGIVAGPFAVSDPPLPITIGAGATATITITYAPLGVGGYTQDLKLPYNSGACQDTIRVALSGSIEDPVLIPEFADIDFGALSGCEDGKDTTIALRNDNGVYTISVSGATLPAGFRLITSTPIDIPPGESRNVTIRFEPSAQGNASGGISFGYDPCDKSASLNVTGLKQGVSFTVPASVDFGEVVSCEPSGRTRQITVNYAGDGTDGSIQSVTVNGPFATTMVSGATLPDGTPQSFDITFVPVADGSATGYIDVTFAPCNVTRRIELTGNQTTAELTAVTPLDFGLVAIAAGAQQQDFYFVNTGSATITVDDLTGVAAPFAVISTTPPLDAQLFPGDTLFVRIEYTPVTGVRTSPIQADVSIPCTEQIAGELRGEGENRGGYARLRIPAFAADAGERITINLELAEEQNLDDLGATTVTGTLMYDASMLVPVGGAWVDNTVTGNREIDVTWQRTPGSTTLTSTQEFVAVLGKVETTSLQLANPGWINGSGTVTTDVDDGEFTLTGLCHEGGTRLFDGANATSIKTSRPNPSNSITQLEYELAEPGTTKLYITDIVGKTVMTLVDGVADPGQYIITFNASKLSTGMYFYVLETPTQTLTRRMEVQQ